MDNQQTRRAPAHDHVFLGEGHERNERRTWFVIVLCGIMMMIEIVGGLLYGSIALVADGLHMSTHAGALLLAALAYTYSRKYAHDDRFGFGTGKFGDLAGFTSAVVLVMIALLIGYESVSRFLAPVPIHFGEAIPIAVLGLRVNIASAWLLSGGHDHHHGHGHGHGTVTTMEKVKIMAKRRSVSTSQAGRSRSRSSKMVYLHASDCGAWRLRPSATSIRRSKRSARTAAGNLSQWPLATAIGKAGTRSPSRMPSLPRSWSGPPPMTSRSNSTTTATIAATTICGPPSSTSSPMPPFPSW